MNDKVKPYCYDKCGPVVITGGIQSTWYVCKKCKCEISERLYNEIKDREKPKKESSQIILDELWNINFGGDDDGTPPY